MKLLQLIGFWQNDAQSNRELLEDLDERQSALYLEGDNDEKELSSIEEETDKARNKACKIGLKLLEAYNIFGKNVVKKGRCEKILNKKFSIKQIYALDDYICGRVSRGTFLRICMGKNCTTTCHKKTRFGLKMRNSLYLTLVGNLAYPLPICNRENASSFAYLSLKKKYQSKKLWN